MNHYRWIDYPKDLDPKLKARYEELADKLLKEATQPIAIAWAHEDEDWTDETGNNPERNRLLVTEHTETENGEWTYGKNLSTHKLD